MTNVLSAKDRRHVACNRHKQEILEKCHGGEDDAFFPLTQIPIVYFCVCLLVWGQGDSMSLCTAPWRWMLRDTGKYVRFWRTLRNCGIQLSLVCAKAGRLTRTQVSGLPCAWECSFPTSFYGRLALLVWALYFEKQGCKPMSPFHRWLSWGRIPIRSPNRSEHFIPFKTLQTCVSALCFSFLFCKVILFPLYLGMELSKLQLPQKQLGSSCLQQQCPDWLWDLTCFWGISM